GSWRTGFTFCVAKGRIHEIGLVWFGAAACRLRFERGPAAQAAGNRDGALQPYRDRDVGRLTRLRTWLPDVFGRYSQTRLLARLARRERLHRHVSDFSQTRKVR